MVSRYARLIAVKNRMALHTRPTEKLRIRHSILSALMPGAEGVLTGTRFTRSSAAAVGARTRRADVEVDVAPARLFEDADRGRLARGVFAAHP